MFLGVPTGDHKKKNMYFFCEIIKIYLHNVFMVYGHMRTDTDAIFPIKICNLNF